MSITFKANFAGNATTAATTTISTFLSCAVGDLITVYFWNGNNPGQSAVVSDNKNTGNYTLLGTATDGTRYQGVAYIVANATASSNLNIIISGLNAGSGITAIAVNTYNGFSTTPTYAGTGTSDYTNNLHYGSTSTAVSGTSFNTSQSTELVIAHVYDIDGNTWGTAPSAPWNLRGSVNFASGNPTTYDQIVSTQGTAVQLTGTLAVADVWGVTQSGFYAFVTAPVPPAPFSVTQFFVQDQVIQF